MEWISTEIKPREHKRFLVWSVIPNDPPNWLDVIALYDKEDNVWIYRDNIIYPTHYQELPKPPKNN